MIFDDRCHAGELLAKRLSRLKIKPQDTIICAIPRGGVIVASVISKILDIPMTCLVIKKLGAPNNPELAIGAVASKGSAVLDRWLISDLKVSPDYLKKEILKKKKEANVREDFLKCRIFPSRFKRKTVIVVDDGLATGQTAKAAAKILKSFKPKKLILAIPCGSPEVVKTTEERYDKVICLEESQIFWAVGQFYRDFRPIEDEEVKEILLR